jgi:hypothetical protein
MLIRNPERVIILQLPVLRYADGRLQTVHCCKFCTRPRPRTVSNHTDFRKGSNRVQNASKILSFTLVLNVSRGDLAGDGEKMLGEMAPKFGDEMTFKFGEDVLLSSLLSGRRRLVRYEDRRDTLGGGVEKSGGGMVKSGPPETGARLFRFTSKVMLEDFFMSWNVSSI